MAGRLNPPKDARKLADEVLTLCLLLVRTSRVHDESEALTPAQRSLLSRLINQGPMQIGQLAGAERVKAPTMTRLVQRLEQHGFVIRKKDPDDQRNILIDYTSKAWSKMEKSRGKRTGVLADRIERLTQKDRRLLAQCLPIIRSLIHEPPQAT